MFWRKALPAFLGPLLPTATTALPSLQGYEYGGITLPRGLGGVHQSLGHPWIYGCISHWATPGFMTAVDDYSTGIPHMPPRAARRNTFLSAPGKKCGVLFLFAFSFFCLAAACDTMIDEYTNSAISLFLIV